MIPIFITVSYVRWVIGLSIFESASEMNTCKLRGMSFFISLENLV